MPKKGVGFNNFTKTTGSAIHFPTIPKVEILERIEQCDAQFVKISRNFKRH